MSKYRILRISHACERSHHALCQGYDDRRAGRQFRCQCACHKARKEART